MRLLLAALATGALALVTTPALPDGEPRFRRPVALVLRDRWLFVANRESGAIATVDSRDFRVVNEAAIGKRLSDLAATKDARRIVALDEAAHEVVLCSRRDSALEVLARVAVSPFPVRLALSQDGEHCFVASLWSRRLSIVRSGAQPSVEKSVSLPFAPRELLLLEDGTRLVVAAAFGGELAVVDVGRGEVESVRSHAAHNIRGLATNAGGDGVLLTHQRLDTRARASATGAERDVVMTNHVLALCLESVLSPEAPLASGSREATLASPANGGGDPAGIAVTGHGTIVVALAGVGEVAVGSMGGGFRRLPAGRHPAAVIASDDGTRAFVANEFSDSLSVIDLEDGRVRAEVSLGPLSPRDVVRRGEELFRDARLSRDGSFSCHSCHTDGHSNGLLSDTLSDGTFGTPKRILSLLGVADTAPWAWNGGLFDLNDQIVKSVEDTMAGGHPAVEDVNGLMAFLRQLAPPPSLASLDGAVDTAAVRRGERLFRRQRCDRCHTPPEYTSLRRVDVGLADEAGKTRFNPPSLRGVGHRRGYFHDSRARGLEDVFERFRHPDRTSDLRDEEIADLVAFLRSL